jgi:hypothetical protein
MAMRAAVWVVLVGCASAEADAPHAEPTWFENAGDFAQGVAAVRKRAGDKWGFIDHAGVMIVAPQFDDVEDPNLVGPDGYVVARRGDRTWVIVGPGGKLSAPITADGIERENAGIALAKLGSRYAIVDARTGAVDKRRYDRDDLEMLFRCPLYEVKRPTACVVDRLGSCIADEHGESREGGPQRTAYVTLKRRKQRGLYDCAAGAFILPFADGGDILTPEADGAIVARNAHEDVVVYGLDGRVRLGPLVGVRTIDRTVVDGRMRVSGPAGVGYLDRDGKLAVAMTFDEGNRFSEGLAAVRHKATGGESMKWGFIDPAGNLAIPYRWDNVGDFHEGFAAVEQGEKWGYIDRAGKLVVPIGLSDATALSGGAATANDGKTPTCLRIERGSLTAVAMRPFRDIDAFHGGRAAVTLVGATAADQRCGYIDEHCAVIGKVAYWRCGSFSERGRAWIEWPSACSSKPDCAWDLQLSALVDRGLFPLVHANVVEGMIGGVRLPMFVGNDYSGGHVSEHAPDKTRQGLVWNDEVILPVSYNAVFYPQDGFVQVRRDDGKRAFFSTVDRKPLVAK